MERKHEKSRREPANEESQKRQPVSARRPTPTLIDENPLISRGLD